VRGGPTRLSRRLPVRLFMQRGSSRGPFGRAIVKAPRLARLGSCQSGGARESIWPDRQIRGDRILVVPTNRPGSVCQAGGIRAQSLVPSAVVAGA
jgi:hypothetical protein